MTRDELLKGLEVLRTDNQRLHEDSRVLLQSVKVKTRPQARRLLDHYVSPAAQATNAEDIEHALEELFPQ